MAKPGPKASWDIIRSVSVTEIAREANRPVSVAVIGPPALRAEAVQALFKSEVPAQTEDGQPILTALPEPAFIQGYEAVDEEAKFPQQEGVFDFVIDVGGQRDAPPAGLVIYSLSELGGWDSTLDRILDDKPTLMLALARNFPAFRRRVAQRIISETASANAKFSLVTGIAEAFPLLREIGFPVAILSDVIVLTKNQALMSLRLAAAYGLPLDYQARLKDLLPILANALGWRALARELVGLVPVVGVLIKPTIAYAGTATLGKAAQLYYETGERITPSHAKQIYEEAYRIGKTRVKELAANLRRSRKSKAQVLPDQVENQEMAPNEKREELL